MNYEKGSEWRQWDLHVHTPESHGFIGDWDQFKEQLQQAKCDVIGINDYFSVAGYKKIKDEITNKTIDVGEKYLLPIVEMRMTESLQNRHAKNSVTHFNFHIIFNPKIKISDIERFIESLVCEGTTIGSDYDDKNKLKDKKVSFTDTLNSLNKDTKFKGNFLIWLPYDEYGGIDEIHPNTDRWIKNNYIKKSDILGSSNKKQIDFFLWRSSRKSDGSPKFTEQEFEDWLEHKIPCIKGSDSHHHEYPIGHLKGEDSKPIEKFCWIKADPTFEGLKQIIYEPENRVYIGEEPPIISKVKNNKTKYINFLKVNQANENHAGDVWFNNIDIPFNKELVAIIGNKGSGKSGIADILGLAGDTHTDKKYFSFLNKQKFLNGNGKLAEKFTAQIIWESGGQSDKRVLNEGIKAENPESVRFIPQNYFEELTNEIEISKFQQVLENIIFGYIPENEKFGNFNFNELEKYKTDDVKEIIQIQKNEIQGINNEIIDLEKKKHPDYLKQIKGLITNKETEIKSQEQLLQELPKIVNPSDNDQTKHTNNIAKYNANLTTLQRQLNEKTTEKTNIANKLEDLNQLKTRIEQQKQYLDEFLQNNLKEARKYELDINKILQVKTDDRSINKLIDKTQKALQDINVYFESYELIKEQGTQENKKSIVYKIKTLKETIERETKKLTSKGQIFQKNEQEKQSINAKIKKLTGSGDNPENETLEFYQKEKKFIEKELTILLKTKRDERIDKSLKIFKKKSEIITLYNSFKRTVDEKIKQNQELLKDYEIKIDSSFNLNAEFYKNFLSYINQGKKGCFYGKDEGEDKIKSIIDGNGFRDESNIKVLLQNIITSLEENNAEINEQINKDELNGFYDYLFSLDYINPKYELKLGEKSLAQLSPGERGALLLIFYLMIDKEEIPLIIDQPEDNLDNESVYNMLSKFIKQAKKNRQIIMVTHNPNLAVGADAEQIIYVNIDKIDKNTFSFISGSIENPKINKKIVQILEGTKPAFDKRKLKYQG